MPIIQVTFIEGPDEAAQRRLLGSLTDAVERDLGVPREAINVVLTSVPARAWARAGVPLSERPGHDREE